jgi:hypothetical protein
VAHERAVDAHDARRAETLHDASERQRIDRPGHGAGERGEGEEDKARLIDAAVADDVAKRGQR